MQLVIFWGYECDASVWTDTKKATTINGGPNGRTALLGLTIVIAGRSNNHALALHRRQSHPLILTKCQMPTWIISSRKRQLLLSLCGLANLVFYRQAPYVSPQTKSKTDKGPMLARNLFALSVVQAMEWKCIVSGNCDCSLLRFGVLLEW
jgi:hypothetical protein